MLCELCGKPDCKCTEWKNGKATQCTCDNPDSGSNRDNLTNLQVWYSMCHYCKLIVLLENIKGIHSLSIAHITD